MTLPLLPRKGTKTSLQERLRNTSLVHPVIPEAATELDRLQARVAELEVDAERYRWLRAVDAGNCAVFEIEDNGLPKPYQILIGGHLDNFCDAAIDTARKAKP